MGSRIIVWLGNNWFALLSFVITIYVALVLRPRPLIRYWIRAVGVPGRTDVYIPFGATRTRLDLRNVGSEPIDKKQWRVPLSIECHVNIIKIDLKRSHSDIVISGEIMRDHPQRALLKVSHLNKGDEVAFVIHHDETKEEPQLYGEIRGYRDTLARGLTINQRFLGIFSQLTLHLPLNYVEIASIAWLVESRLNFVNVLRGIVFLLASPLPVMISAVLFRSAALERRPQRAELSGCVLIVTHVMRVIAFCVAWFAGYRLWYPQIAAFLAAVSILATVIAVPLWEKFTRAASPEANVTPASVGFVWALIYTIFAVFVAAGIGASVLLPVGLACAIATTVIQLDRQLVRYRLSAALRIPGGYPLEPPPRA